MSASKSTSKSTSAERKYRPETRLVHAGTLRSQFGETSEALYLTQGFVYETAASAERRFKNEEPGYQYSRFANPTIAMFEARMAAFEGAEAARATATGMAAVTTAILGQLKAGDHVVAAKALFGSCRYVVEDFLPRYGISSTLIDGTDLKQWQDAMRPNTKTCFIETPTNPTLEIITGTSRYASSRAGWDDTCSRVGYRLGSERGSPNHESALLSNRVMARMRSPTTVST